MIVRLDRPERAKSADPLEHERYRDREAGELHRQLNHVHPCRGQQAAGREVGRDHQTADHASLPGRHAGDDLEDHAHREQLSGEDEQRADPQESGDQRAHRRPIAKLEVVADRPQVARRRHPPDRGPDPERQDRAAERGRSHPPPRRDAARIAERGRVDGRSGADVRGQHRREDQARAERAAGDEEIRCAADAAADQLADADQQGRVGEQERELEVHERSDARSAVTS